jgi:hypothetical protein
MPSVTGARGVSGWLMGHDEVLVPYHAKIVYTLWTCLMEHCDVKHNVCISLDP